MAATTAAIAATVADTDGARKPSAGERDYLPDRESVGAHGRFGAAGAARGEQLERAAAVWLRAAGCRPAAGGHVEATMACACAAVKGERRQDLWIDRRTLGNGTGLFRCGALGCGPVAAPVDPLAQAL
jgi:hypothetical protein